MFPSPNVEAIAQFLSTVKGFRSIATADIELLAQEVEVRNLKAGTYLIHKNDVGDSMHVIHTGKVEIPILDTNGDLRLSVTLTWGAIVGEIGLLTGKRRVSDVLCLTDVTSIVFHREGMLRVMRAYPPVAHFLTEILMERISEDRTLGAVGNYRLGRQLGRGMTSTVYEATHNTLARLAAAKMLSHSLVYDESFLCRFIQEAGIIAELNHPNIVPIYDLEEAYGTRFIIMERVDGQSLDSILAMRKTLSASEVIAIIGQIAAALAHAHAHGVIHGDVKPANCILSPDGYLKLLDFGVSQRFGKGHGNRSSVGGTPAYIAPELIMGKDSNERCDIYSLGAMAFKLVTGRSVFPADTVDKVLAAHLNVPPPDPSDFCPDLPQNLVAFIKGCLVKNPDRRLNDWGQITELLDTDQVQLALKLTSGKMGTEAMLVSYPIHLRDEAKEPLSTLSQLGATVTPIQSHQQELPLLKHDAPRSLPKENNESDNEKTEFDIGANKVSDNINVSNSQKNNDKSEKPGNIISSLQKTYLKWVEDDITSIKNAYDRAVSDPDNRKKHLADIFCTCLVIKTQGDSFDYPLVTLIANLICRIFEMTNSPGENALPVIKAHIDAMQLVISSHMKNHDGVAGVNLVKELEAAAAEILR